MQKYNVINVGGEVLNLDGALEIDAANKLANEIEAENDIEVKVVPVSPRYAVISDCTPNNGTIVAISANAAELIDLHTDDTMRAIRLHDTSVSVGDRIAVDWDASQVNLADCL